MAKEENAVGRGRGTEVAGLSYASGSWLRLVTGAEVIG